MGQFKDSLEMQVANMWESTCIALREKNDGSLEEFVEALNDNDITAPMIQIALKKTLGIEASETTIRRWRHKLKVQMMEVSQ